MSPRTSPERRREPRCRIAAILRLVVDSVTTSTQVVVVDASGCGMRLLAPGLDMARDVRVHIRVHGADGGLNAVGRIVRRDRDEVGLHFGSVSARDAALMCDPRFWAQAEELHIAMIDMPAWWHRMAPRAAAAG